ncbi:MAG TPA: nucleoside triphosphate pyrophosphohydrolase [Roseiarcus sp.]|nr:nucleoside triphosphate pyrophosphohydrolase [Roseiarcus sp.]
MQSSRDIDRLLAIMAALRTPGSGCPWDLEQNFKTIAPFTIEEAYEVADAIEREDFADLKDELGDLLLQVVFHAQMAKEALLFDFNDVVEAITAKLIRRHPHVFGDTRNLSAEAVKTLWAKIKAEEKRTRAAARGATQEPKASALAGAPLALPALSRALKLQQMAGKVGFDWNDARAVLAKLREETDEIDEALRLGDEKAVRDEIGDLLFVVANLARHLKVDPEAALRGANAKFERRFAHIEARLAEEGRGPSQATLEEMDALWDEAKHRERDDKFGATVNPPERRIAHK